MAQMGSSAAVCTAACKLCADTSHLGRSELLLSCIGEQIQHAVCVTGIGSGVGGFEGTCGTCDDDQRTSKALPEAVLVHATAAVPVSPVHSLAGPAPSG